MNCERTLLLLMQRSDLIWTIKLRKAVPEVRFIMLTTKCPCCIQRAIRANWFKNDQKLKEEFESIDAHLGKILDKITIENYEK